MQTIEIPAQSGAGVHLAAGATLRIIDVEGSQVADLFAVCADGHDEWLSVAHTRGVNWRLFPEVGGVFVSTNYRPMLTFVRDDSPGFHDAQFSACDPVMYERLGFEGYHPSCAENFRTAAASVDWRPLHVPDPVNFFQRTPIVDGALQVQSSVTAPGDSVTLRAETDVFVVVTACSMDVKEINGQRCTPIQLQVSGPES